jgi:RNA polymerase sigma-70 factor (ECF subfamily)
VRLFYKVLMPDDLARLYDGHARALFAFALNLTRSEADARDVLQEVFCRLAARPALLEGVRNERAFMLRLAHNQAVDLFRRRTTREKPELAREDEASTGHPFAASARADEEGFRRALADALGELPPEQRAVVHLKLWEEATFEEIAEVLAISPNTAASRYRYAIDKLRVQLRPLYNEVKNLWTTSNNT